MAFINSRPSIVDNNVKLAQLFQQTHDEALRTNEENRKTLTRQKEDYVTLRSQLGTLPGTLSQDVMVPIGSRALMKGKIVHTNEILVCLGAGWFAKQSAKGATEICNRRLMLCDEMLANLDKERDLLSSRRKLPVDQEVFSDEITESYNEEEEAKWRVRHREKEREYHQQLKEHRREEKLSKTDEELWNRLEQLELQEELQQELNKFHHENDQQENLLEHQSAEQIFSKLSEEHTLKRRVLFDNDKPLVEINNRESGDKTLDSERQPALVTESYASSNLSNELLDKNIPKRRVSFVEENSFAEFVNANNSEDEDSDSDDEPLYIKFHHSALLGQSKKPLRISDNQVQTPGDIYNIVAKTVPKSILKQRSHDSNTNVNETGDLYRHSLGQTELDFEPNKNLFHETNLPLAFGEVVERPTEEITNNLQKVCAEYKRPVSRFRSKRQTTS